MIRHCPLGPFQEAVYKLLTTHQTAKVYNIPTLNVEYPCISLRGYDISIGGAKNVDISEISVEMGVYSKYKGVEEIAGVLNDIENVLTNVRLDLSADRYDVIAEEISGKTHIEAIADTNTPVKYAATIVFTAKIQYIGG